MLFRSDRIATKALFHDLPEIFTGDIPTPVKYYSEDTRVSYSAVEDAALEKLFDMLPEELRPSYETLFDYTPEEKKLIKAADKICALLKCRDEAHFGNPEFCEAEKTLLQSINDADCEEALYFLEAFGESFSKPIDTLIQNKNHR